jgi:isopenicillin N synthase-like dioxygenase
MNRIVTMEYTDLLKAPSPATIAAIESAFGVEGLGLLLVRGVPNFAQARAAALPHAYTFGLLPKSTLDKYEHSASSFSFGWSHGKEKLGGKPDAAKGSFYFNPILDEPDAVRNELTQDPSLAPFLHANIWPSGIDAPNFEHDIKILSRLMVETGGILAPHVDAFTASFLTKRGASLPIPSATLQSVIRDSLTHKGRLLYYFSSNSSSAADITSDTTDTSVDNWCGWHNDHSSLTALTPALYFDHSGNQTIPQDTKGGLYIRARDGTTVRAIIPSDCLAFQIGEAAQIMSGGSLQATPHCVRASSDLTLSRGTLAVFCGPEHSAKMSSPEGAQNEDILRGAQGELLPPGVQTLILRWKSTDTFREFSLRTLASYY